MYRSRITLAGVAVLALVACTDQDEAAKVLAPTEPNYSEHAAPVIAHGGPNKIRNQYIVVFKEDSDDVISVSSRHDVETLYTYNSAIKGFAAKLNRGQLEKLQHDPAVEYIEEDGIVSMDQEAPPSQTPDLDSEGDLSAETVQAGATWGIDKLDQEHGAGTNGSYNYTDVGSKVNVYVLDTGIRYTHNDFDGLSANRAKKGIDIVTPGGTAADCNGHGTHVAATAIGTTYGVAKNAKAYSVRVLDCAGNGTFSGAIAGVDWVSNNHIKPAVANMSLGGGFSAAMNAAVAKSISYGVTYVLAAGNSAIDACTVSPASTPTAITVGGTDIANVRYAFSNIGPCVDINGPAVGITSAWFTSDVATAVLNGTSMASPHVAGLVALYLQANSTAAYGLVTDVILDAAVIGEIAGLPAGTPNLLAHKVNGNLAGAGALDTEPDLNAAWSYAYYFSGTDGYHRAWLRGTPGTNYNLRLYRWNGAAWILVATKAGGSTNEILIYNGLAGFYYYEVSSGAGAGTYDLYHLRPD